jgi:hypothetical protein
MLRLDYWKKVKNYPERYFVSYSGFVRSRTVLYPFPRYKYLGQQKSVHGYKQVGLSKSGMQKTFGVHRIVAQTFIPNPNRYLCVNHKNGVKTDNSVNNLEWCTHSQNSRHAIKNGLSLSIHEQIKMKGVNYVDCNY